jgi:hypothetical protein
MYHERIQEQRKTFNNKYSAHIRENFVNYERKVTRFAWERKVARLAIQNKVKV